jgi:hypothetical protein
MFYVSLLGESRPGPNSTNDSASPQFCFTRRKRGILLAKNGFKEKENLNMMIDDIYIDTYDLMNSKIHTSIKWKNFPKTIFSDQVLFLDCY